ncbi:alpha/beta hydrolase [Novosphingobium pentaromativorans]|uniref:Alpha/beta hydrolase fold-3 domain-containing protein n=1 Tax=Novosphingobium pentaromativorans US6-1 TaxID=1088721 RepID=G6EAS9_9SPHN|nr:alpha/beta hydrolase [Novosphingobium pentaromativorans]EHJ61716.1 hypothetical protein NSU_1477 [Novosphingobium pentaromativorans US6-1]
MPMDEDARAMMEMLEKMVPLPTSGTDAGAYRAERIAELNAREIELIEVDRVETFSIPRGDGDVTVRLYRHGPGDAVRPTILYMHGGGFVTCSIETHDPYCRTLARETGLSILSIDYRLAPEDRHPAAFEDCRAVLEWAAGPSAAERGIDADRLIVAGDSAGGALAAALCLWARDNAGPAIVHQLLIYPVTNNDFTTASYRDNATGNYLTTESMRWFWEQYLGDADAEADQFAAPGKAADFSGLPSATVITAGYDPLRDDGGNYARELEKAGVPVEYRDFSGTFHGFAGMFMLQSARDALTFIKQRLGDVAGPR